MYLLFTCLLIHFRFCLSLFVMMIVLITNLIYDLKMAFEEEKNVKKHENFDDAFDERILAKEDEILESDVMRRREIPHVAFLKVHKTASSTAQNVFLRFGDSRKLTFILAHTHGESTWLNVISYVNSITKDNVVPPPPGKHYEILCCHVIYNRESFEKVLPEDTVYIGIVREPYSRFQSAVKYFNPGHIINIPGDHPVSVYAENPLKYEPSNPRLSQTNNRMAVEFGFPDRLFPGREANGSRKEIDAYLRKLDKEFRFIIISELFEESMVYMKRILGWTTKDVLFVDKNKSNPKPNPRKLVSEDNNKKLSKFIYLDIALYDFAMHRFEEQVKAEGKDFQHELEYFKEVKEKANKFCTQKSQLDHIYFKESRWDKEFNLTKEDCKFFFMNEKDFIQRQRMRLYGTLDN